MKSSWIVEILCANIMLVSVIEQDNVWEYEHKKPYEQIMVFYWQELINNNIDLDLLSLINNLLIL
jgi:hypothetical protein